MNGTRGAAIASTIAGVRIHSLRVESPRAWHQVTLSAVACVTLLDAALLERKHGLFTGGFLASYQLQTVADSTAFVILSALLNAAIAAPLALAALMIGRRLRLRPRAAMFAAFCAAVLPFAIADFLSYQIWTYLGDAFDFHVMYALTGHRIGEVFAVTAPLMSRPFVLFFLGLFVLIGLTTVLQRFDRNVAESLRVPGLRQGFGTGVALVVASSVAVTIVLMTSESMGVGLRWTPSGQLFTSVLNRLSDVDRDGYGLMQSPRDIAPFDAAIYPYAVDLPRNGINENGLAGDLPLGTSEYTAPPIINGDWPERPPVILFVLESVRADAVGATHGGHRVTPVMDMLAAEGVKVDDAWSHAGSTSQSRYHLLAGSLVESRSSTLLDDFKDHGYDVGYFSGQDDEFGSMGLNYKRVDRFYDARQDLSERYSTSTMPGSLAVPFTVVERRITDYLSSRRDSAPLFLYVNFHDTHYPYSHAGMENLLGVGLLPASLISPGRRAELTSTYLNAVANVDRAIGRVIKDVETHVGKRPAVVIIGDHGESLFEQGVLGHGFALTAAQMRVPLVIRGLSMNVTTPFGLTDLRAGIVEALAKGQPTSVPPSVQQSRAARVFQYLGSVATPGQIGWMTVDGSFSYDFRSERVGLWQSSVRPGELVGEPKRAFDELVHSWEGMLLARAK